MNVYLPFTARLPSAYQEVEYILNTSGEYIDTGFVPKSTTRVKCKVMVTGYASGGTDGGIYGVWLNWSGNTRFNLWHWNNSGYGFGYGSNNGSSYCVNIPLNTVAEVDNYISSGTVYNIVNGTTTTYSGASFTGTTGNIYLFRRNIGGGQRDGGIAYTRYYYMKIYDSGTIVRDFVPCYRKSDNVIGMYDLVNNQFYTNSGTGTFSKGNDVTMSELKNAYIGEVWTPGSNTIAYYPLNSTTTVNDMSGNNRNLTNYSATFGTYQGVNSVNIVGDSKYILGNISSIPQGANARTFNFWTYNSNGSVASSGIEAYFLTGTESTNQMILFMCSESGANYNRVSQYGDGSGTNFGTPKRKQWVNMCLVYDGTKFICYENGTKKGEWTYTINTSGTKFSLGVKRAGSASNWNKFSGYFSNFIIENKTWTDEEILNYYNNTKSNYGL